MHWFVVIGVIIIALVVGMGTGVINLQNLQSTGGVPQPITTTITGTGFSGQLDVVLQHFNSLDNSIQFTEGVASDVHTVFYKSGNGGQFSSIGQGALGQGGASRVTITPEMNSILYATSGVAPTMTQLYSDPEGTQLATDRITEFSFEDVTNSGSRDWLYKIDLRGVESPIAGQGASTIPFITKSWNVGSPSINSPADIFNLGSDAGTITYVRWELTVAQGTATPQTEYTMRIQKTSGANGTQFWDTGLSTLDIPNIGMVSLSDFVETLLSPSNTLYSMKIGDRADFANANYVITTLNGNDVHPIPFKISTSLQDNAQNDNLLVTLTIKSIDHRGGSNTPLTDSVILDES